MAQPESTEGRSGGRRIRGLDAAQRRDLRRDQLLDAALELFAANGYAATSIEQICQLAYVSTKSFYEVFDNREACYVALLQRISTQVRAHMVTALHAVRDDGTDLGSAMLETYVHAMLDDPRRVTVAFGGLRAMSEAVERVRRDNRRWAADYLETIWAGHGVVGDNHRVAIAVIGGLFDLITDWLLDADPGDPAAVAALIADLRRFYRVVHKGLLAG